MTGLAQIFILAFVIIVVMVFLYILYNYAIGEFKKNYRKNRIEVGMELIETTERDLNLLKNSMRVESFNNNDDKTIAEIIKDIETDIKLLKDFIENI